MTNKIKKLSKRFLSIALCLIMLATTFFIFNPFTIKVHAATDYTVKSATNEYYYPAGSKFVSYLAIGYSGNKASNAKSPLTNDGYIVVEYDMNAGASGDWVYIGYKITTDISKALRDVGVRIAGSEPDQLTSEVNGLTYYIVGKNDLGNNSVTDPATGAADGVRDLNKGIHDAPFIHLYATRDIKAGPPIASFTAGDGIDAPTSPSYTVNWLTTDSEKGQSVTAGTRADMNKGAGGDYAYVNGIVPNNCTSVDSTAMRAAMNRAQTFISNNSDNRYVSVSNLQSALNNAILCYNALQAYAASTYSQASINSLTTAINDAIDELQTEVSLNPNGGTLSNSTGVKKVTYTVGGFDPSFAFPVSSYTPTRNYYDFMGWSTSSTATSGNMNDVTVYLTSRTVYATWSPITYTIGYTLNDGSVSTANPTSYNVETDTFTLNNPTKTHYTFTGWTGSNGSTPQTSVTIVKGSNGNRTYTANYTPIEYSISYTLNGGTHTNPESYNIETATFSLTAPTRTGYAFTGWTGSNGSTPQTSVSIAKGSTGDKSYTANWTATPYTISYNLNGGSATNPSGYNIETATFTLNNPTKTGYTFTGWTGSNGSTAQTSVTITKGSTGDKSYVANWTINSYTITFNTNGGSAIASITQNYNTAVTAPANPTKNGYTFAGWDRTIPQTMPAENITINANWTINQYTITFNTNGGSAIAPITQNYNTAVTAPANPTKNGYTFVGWDRAIPQTMPAENVTVNAQWTTDPYTISYNLKGGTATNPSGYNIETETFTLNNPEKTGYTFTGWSGTGIDGTSMNVSITQGSTGNKSYTANWTGNTYTVTFDSNDGTGTMDPQTFTYGTSQALTANNFQKDGYYFAGWSTTPNGNVVYRDKKSVSNLSSEQNGEVTLYAVWNLVTEFDVEIPSYCGQVSWSTHPDLDKYQVATVTTPATRQGKYFVYWTATYNDGTTEIASTYRTYSFFVTRDVSLTPLYVATENEYRTERAKALIVSRVTGIGTNNDGSSSLLIEHSVSPNAIDNDTSIIGHGVIYTANELYKDNLNLESARADEDDVIFNKIAGTSQNNLSGLLEVNVGNESRVWATPYIIDENGTVHYGTMKEMNASSSIVSFDEAFVTDSVMSFDLTSMNEDAEELTIEEPQPIEDEQFEQPTTIFEWIIKIITTIVEKIVAIIEKAGIVK